MNLDLEKHLHNLKKERCLSKLNTPLNELLEDLNLFDSSENVIEDTLKVQEIIETLCQIGRVKEFSCELSRDFEEKDFKGVSSIASTCFQCLNQIVIKTDCLKWETNFTIYLPIILICGTYHKIFLWSNAECINLQKILLERLCSHKNCESLAELLLISDSQNSVLVKKLFENLKPSLTSEKWKRNPSSPQIFKWILESLPYYFVSEVLQDIFPPTLLLLDDFQIENQILGIECADLIVKHTPKAMLNWNGLAEVFHDALFRLTRSKEPQVIDLVFPCILTLISGLEKDPNRADRNKHPGYIDAIYNQLLIRAEMESKLQVIESYSKLLPIFIDKLGITVLRHFQRTKRLIFEYLSVYKGPSEISRIFTLRALQKLIAVAWPRIPNYTEEIMKALAKLLYDIDVRDKCMEKNQNANEILINECKTCLILLYKASPEIFEELVLPLYGSTTEIPTSNVFLEICESEKK